MGENGSGSAGGRELLEEYKLYIEDLANVGTRHTDTSKFYVSLISALLVFLSLAGPDKPLGFVGDAAVIAISLLAVLLCVFWFLTIRSYSQLYKAKFEVLRDMETDLSYHCFEEEWTRLEEMEFKPVTRLEQAVTLLMTIPFLVVMVFTVIR